MLTSITTTVEIDTRISDLFRSPMDQVKEQLTLAVDKMKERQENEVLNNRTYGLLNNIDPDMRVKPRKGTPTPDDLDELISTVWKEPSFFLAHPKVRDWLDRYPTKGRTVQAEFHDDDSTWRVKVWWGVAGQIADGKVENF